MSVEIELKLAIAPGDAARLRRHPLLKGVKPGKGRLYGIYFDTPDFDLQRKRGAFRLRREGYHWVQAVKLEARSVGGLSTRPEWEARVTGNRPDTEVLPAEARQHLDPAIVARLAPVFATDFQRTTWRLALPAGELEIALDMGHIRAGENDLPVAEVELELKSGEGAVLFEAALALLEEVPLLPEYRSKALRGYELVGAHRMAPCKATDVEIGKHLPAPEAWRRLLLSGLIQLSHNLPGFLAGDDPEYLHQMRVAVRRLRTVLSLGRTLGLTPESWVDELRWFMGELGPARDWDVMETQTLAGVRARLSDPGRLDALLSAVRRMRSAGQARARAAVTDRRFARLLLEMGRDLLDARDGKPEVSAWGKAALDRRWRRFKRLAARFADLDAAGRHRLRIAAKRLRYAGEAFAPLYGKPAARFLESLARLQDSLGAANDVAIAHTLLAGLNQRGDLGHGVGLVEGFLAGGSAAGGLERLADQVGVMATAKPYWR